MSDLDLPQIKDNCLNAFKNNAPDPGKVEHFLTECWIEAVVAELNKKNIINLKIEKDHSHLIKDS